MGCREFVVLLLMGWGLMGAMACAPVQADGVVTGRDVNRNDHFLTVGGGWAPAGNQVSLEKNVLYFQRVLEGLGLGVGGGDGVGGVAHHVLFADGEGLGRDVQYVDPERLAPDLNYYLAELLGEAVGLDDRYRDHTIEGVSGAATRAEVTAYFDVEGAALGPKDRLVFYFTGHGGGASDKKKAPGNTLMHLWNDQDMSVRQMTDQLDKVDPQTPVVMVMVQCFSGGFANVIFEGGDPEKGLAAHNRAGFFATVHNRLAAGCTPDINEANYREYSTYFWAAIHGRSRLGETVEPPDYNEDGRVSFNEAHAYTLIESNTIDISVKTSDALLRRYASPTRTFEDATIPGTMDYTRSYFRLLSLASPHEKAVLKGLSLKLRLNGDDRVRGAQKILQETVAERRRLGNQRRIKNRQYEQIRATIARSVIARWPELDNPWHPRVSGILEREGEDVQGSIESHPRFEDMQRLGEEMAQLETERDDLERRWVKARRFLHAAQNVALAINLPKTAAPEIVERFHALVQAESAGL